MVLGTIIKDAKELIKYNRAERGINPIVTYSKLPRRPKVTERCRLFHRDIRCTGIIRKTGKLKGILNYSNSNGRTLTVWQYINK